MSDMFKNSKITREEFIEGVMKTRFNPACRNFYNEVVAVFEKHHAFAKKNNCKDDMALIDDMFIELFKQPIEGVF